MTPAEILRQAENIKNVLRSFASGGDARYKISVAYANGLTNGDAVVAKARKKQSEATFITRFEAKLDELVHSPDVAKIAVEIGDGAGRNTSTYTIVLQEAYSQGGQLQVTHHVEGGEAGDGGERSALSNPPKGMFGGLGDLLTLLGYDNGLNGTSSPADNLGAVLSIRDQRIREEYDRRDAMREREQIGKERDEAKAEAARLKTELESAQRKIERLQSQLGDAQEENEELQKLKPENSVLGLSLTELGSTLLAKGLQKSVRANAGLIGKLMGVDKETMLGMIDEQGSETDTTPVATEEPAVEVEGVEVEEAKGEKVENDPITRWSKQIAEYVRRLAPENMRMFSVVCDHVLRDEESLKEIYEQITAEA